MSKLEAINKENNKLFFEEALIAFGELIKKGGPQRQDYLKIEKVCEKLRNNNLTLKEENQFYNVLEPILNLESVIGHTFLKPYGYSGDFELINKIYTKWKSKDDKYKNWDNLYHWADSAKAVRNRKKYFQYQIIRKAKNNHSPLVLNLGSGPCSDVFEYYTAFPKSPVKIECVDMDEKAIKFGSVVCDNYLESVSFINKNVFRFTSNHQYDLIWSAGLFDYFNDKLFVRLITRFYGMLNESGELVIGNFSSENPSRGLMEVICQWYLHHRPEDKLIQLAVTAGVPKAKIKVRSEETGINLFLHLFK